MSYNSFQESYTTNTYKHNEHKKIYDNKISLTSSDEIVGRFLSRL